MATTILHVSKIISAHFNIGGSIKPLPGDEDENFKIESTQGNTYILKIADSKVSFEHLDFLNAVSIHLNIHNISVKTPLVIPAQNGALIIEIELEGIKRYVRLISWIDGRIWATINPKTKNLREQLGQKAGEITKQLLNFEHPAALRTYDCDLAASAWTCNHVYLFDSEEKEIVLNFQKQFTQNKKKYDALPKSVIHGDVNDYNILVSENLKHPTIAGIFDFGDAVYSQTINDVAILIAYASMDVPDPLEAAIAILKGYQLEYTFSEAELHCLYVLVAMRLVTTVTKAAIRQKNESENKYHGISEEPAWDLLKKWRTIHPEFAEYSFRNACGFDAHPQETHFTTWASKNQVSLRTMFPSELLNSITVVDMSVGSTLFGNLSEYSDPEVSEFKLKQFNKQNPTALLANGYLETRPFYTTDAFKSEGNNGPRYRTVHLGTDFWVSAQSPVHAPFEGVVKIIHHNDYDKDYGPMLILEHTFDDIIFYTLYGHLTLTSLSILKTGDRVKQGELIAYIGAPNENGNWAPHLHFQIILDLLGNNANFNGVALPSEKEIWRSICPDPNLVFTEEILQTKPKYTDEEIINFRREHLGKSLSLSYDTPLHIVRGEGVYLIDTDGKKHLDTANNVNHVGHQHPKVVATGQRQMAVLTTNTRYLHEEIIAYTDALLKKLPKELSVLHIVNSGSEANELALRMARTITKSNHMLAIEVGYHGNTNAAMNVSSYKFNHTGGSGKPDTTHILPLPDPYRGKHTGPNCGTDYANYAQSHIDRLKSKGDTIAGFIGESIISCGGQIVPPANYFKDVYKSVRAAGGICISDEVQTGFGRMGKTFWAFELYDVIPDIVTMGKPAGNGHPLAVVACTREVADAFDTGLEFFNTFGGNPVACAIGRSVLEVIEDENLQQNALDVGVFLKSELKRLQKLHLIIGSVRGEGLFLGFEINDANKSPLPEQAVYLANRMKELGILISTDGPDNNVIKIKPPIVFSKENAQELIFRLETVFGEDFMHLPH
jgi:4-aminobutyrate aminotransferase-like enzyme/Ser/Thr protein kinase RdoA (MazF antagonist)